MRAGSRRRVAQKVALAVVAAGVLASTVGVGTAAAATSSSLLYSTDGGATWTSDATVAPGGTVLVRQWYDNDAAVAETGASLTTEVPDGFTLVGGSTEVCLNPSTTDPTAPDPSEELCAASDEGSVWAGNDLTVSPTAGLFGEPNGATSGFLEMGRVRYLNTHQCAYRHVDHEVSEYDVLATVGGLDGGPVTAGTNGSNTADTTAVCGDAATWGLYDFGFGTVLPIDLLGNRYLNLHQCSYQHVDHLNGETDTFQTMGGGVGGPVAAGTNAANTQGGAADCGGAGADSPAWDDYELLYGTVRSLDLVGNQYLNLHQCIYQHEDHPTVANVYATFAGGTGPLSTGTNVSPTVDASPVCAESDDPAWSQYNLTVPSVRPVDLHDPTRGAGYVQYSITAPVVPSAAYCEASFPAFPPETFDQDGTLTSTPSGTLASSGTITVDWPAVDLPADCVPIADPTVVVGVGGLLAVAGAGYIIYRRREAALA